MAITNRSQLRDGLPPDSLQDEWPVSCGEVSSREEER